MMEISFQTDRPTSRTREAWSLIPALLLVLWAVSRLFV